MTYRRTSVHVLYHAHATLALALRLAPYGVCTVACHGRVTDSQCAALARRTARSAAARLWLVMHGVSQSSCKVRRRVPVKTHEMLDSPRAGVEKMHPCGLRLLRRDVDTDTPTRQTSLRRADRPGHVNGHASRTGAHRRCDAGSAGCGSGEPCRKPHAASGTGRSRVETAQAQPRTAVARGPGRERRATAACGWPGRYVCRRAWVEVLHTYARARTPPHASRRPAPAVSRRPAPQTSHGSGGLTRSPHGPHTALTRQWQPRRSSRPADIRCARGGLDAS